MSDDVTPGAADRRARGIAKMAEVYGWEVNEVHGDFLAMTVDHLFGEVWDRPGFTVAERRLLLIGLLVGMGLEDVVQIQLDAALRLGELTPEQCEELVLFFSHYAGWPRGAKLNQIVMDLVAKSRAAGVSGPSGDEGV